MAVSTSSHLISFENHYLYEPSRSALASQNLRRNLSSVIFPMRVRKGFFCFLLSLLLVAKVCHAGEDQPLVDVFGAGECAGCEENNVKTSQAFKGLKVTIDCKPENGEFKTRGSGELDEEGNFKVSLPEDRLKDEKLKEDCYARLHSAAAVPCPVHDDDLESSKVVFKSERDGKQSFGLKGKLKFSPATCASAFLLPPFKDPKLPKFPPIYKKPLPPYKKPFFKKPLLPPIPIYKKPLPSFPKKPFFKKPLLPPIPIYKKPLPSFPKKPFFKKPLLPQPLQPPVLFFKKPLLPFPKKPFYKKPLLPTVPIYKKPLPPFPKKPFPPPFPIYKKPLPKKPLQPPVLFYKKPLPPIPVYKKPLPIYKPKIPFFKPHPPLPPKVLPFPKKKPVPPLPKLPELPPKPKYFPHPKFGKFPPIPPKAP